MRGVPRLQESLGVAAGALIATGGLAAAADAATYENDAHSSGRAGLTSASPDLASSLRVANQQLDFELAAEGPDSCLAKQIASGIGITRAGDRARFVTPENIDLAGKRAARRSQYAGKLGCNSETVAKTANGRKSTTAYQITADEVPKSSKRYVSKPGTGHVSKNSLVGTTGGNVIFRSGGRKLPKKTVSSSVDADVSYGVRQAARQYAAGEISALDGCEDKAGATFAAGNLINGMHFAVKGRKVSFSEFKKAFAKGVEGAKISVGKAVGEFDTQEGCTPPNPGAPHPKPEQPSRLYPETPGQKPWKRGEIGYDVSWANCGQQYPVDAKFVLIGINGGLNFSTNPCLQAQVSAFSSTRENFYLNTGWNDQSAHIDPEACPADDQMCQAYQYGKDAAEYSWDAARAAGLSEDQLKVTWMLDVEPEGSASSNTWSTDVMQNRRSLQGQHDKLLELGAANVIEYNTTQSHQEHFGNWLNGWPSVGATTWATADEAIQYCTGHEFTGGPSWAMQYDPVGIDKDVAC